VWGCGKIRVSGIMFLRADEVSRPRGGKGKGHSVARHDAL
jgi:hypothetical protein